MLSVVIDTNVMMVALSPKSNLHWLYKRLTLPSSLAGDFEVEILIIRY